MSGSVLVVAGEISGDMHLAEVVREVKARDADVRFLGIAGDACRAEGVEIVHDVKEMAVLGLAEVARRYGFFRRVFNEMIGLAAERKPDAVLLVDYPGFNLRFASRMHDAGIKVLYYVCPQVWAWNRSRIARMARIVDHLMVIFPFETEVFAETGLKVDFVGHPLVEETRRARTEPERAIPWQGEPRIALLPGSRRQEIERILPDLWQAAGLLQKEYPEASFVSAAASEIIAQRIRDHTAHMPGGPTRHEVVTGETRHILRQARAAWVASGTATIETALMRCPMVVVYKTSFITYWLGRMLVSSDLKHLGMVNIVAGRTLCPEFIQHEATPAALYSALARIVDDGGERESMLSGLDEVAQALGEGGAAPRVAEIVMEELSS